MVSVKEMPPGHANRRARSVAEKYVWKVSLRWLSEARFAFAQATMHENRQKKAMRAFDCNPGSD